MKYYSQHKQDYWVDKLLKKKINGLFLDIGANDGITISNSWFFEEQRNWTGVCVEPISSVFKKLISNRKCKCLNVCISDKVGTEVFFNLGMLSGIKSDYHPKHWNWIMIDAQKEPGVAKEFELACVPPNTVLAEYGEKYFDFLSIDTEGSELKILKAIDFDTYKFSIISVENPYNVVEFEKYLSHKGFVLCKILVHDYLFINKHNTDLYNRAQPHIFALKLARAIPLRKFLRNINLNLRKIVKNMLISLRLYR